MTQNPIKFYKAQNATNKSQFQGIKLEFGKVHKIIQQAFFQKQADNIAFTCLLSELLMSPGSGTLSKGEKYN
jgi:hypothetical protein